LGKVKSIIPQTEAELTEKNEEIRRLCSRKLSMMKRPKLLNPSTIVMDGDIAITTVGSPINVEPTTTEDLISYKAQSPIKLAPNSPMKLNFNLLPNPNSQSSINTNTSILIPAPEYKPVISTIINYNDNDILHQSSISSSSSPSTGQTSCQSSSSISHLLHPQHQHKNQHQHQHQNQSKHQNQNQNQHHHYQQQQQQQKPPGSHQGPIQSSINGLLTVNDLMYSSQQPKRNPLEPIFTQPLSRYEEIVAWKQKFAGERIN